MLVLFPLLGSTKNGSLLNSDIFLFHCTNLCNCDRTICDFIHIFHQTFILQILFCKSKKQLNGFTSSRFESARQTDDGSLTSAACVRVTLLANFYVTQLLSVLSSTFLSLASTAWLCDWVSRSWEAVLNCKGWRAQYGSSVRVWLRERSAKYEGSPKICINECITILYKLNFIASRKLETGGTLNLLIPNRVKCRFNWKYR